MTRKGSSDNNTSIRIKRTLGHKMGCDPDCVRNA